jgi:hypothetical protein
MLQRSSTSVHDTVDTAGLLDWRMAAVAACMDADALVSSVNDT